MSRFAGKTAWITGASSGIGEALARVLAQEGADLILSGRRVDALEAVAHDLEKNVDSDCLVLPFEATDWDRLAAVVEEAWAWKGRVDLLVNNAGVSQRSLAVDTAPEVYRDLIDIDLLAPIWLTQLQLSRMVEAGGAHIVAISSLAGRFGAPLRTAYSAAKHGLIGYMDALRAESETAHGIRVTNVLPGSVATDVARNALTGDGTIHEKSDASIDGGDDPIDCAKAILDAVVDNVPELLFAKGFELDAANLRHADPTSFFRLIGGMGAQIAENGGIQLGE